MIHHLYRALRAHHPESNHLPSPCIWPPLLPPTPFPSGNYYAVLCVCEFLSVLFVHLLLSVSYPTYEWTHTVLDFFVFPLISFNVIVSRSVRVVTSGRTFPSLMAERRPTVRACIPQLLYPILRRRGLPLPPGLRSCEWCCSGRALLSIAELAAAFIRGCLLSIIAFQMIKQR